MALNASSTTVNEENTALIACVVKDENGNTFNYAGVDAILVTLTNKTDAAVINSREHQDVLGNGNGTPSPVNGGTLDDSGNFELELVPADNIMVGTGTEQEEHDLLIQLAHGKDGSEVSLSNAIATTNASKNVTVTHTSHGLSVGDNVVIKAADDVGGLNPNGNRVLTAVTANTYTFEHTSAATSTAANGGGTGIKVYKKPKIITQSVPLHIVPHSQVPG